MSMEERKLLFSFLVVCYNQEKYIEKALNSALAQDYPNLEIIVSDDCSTDKTFEIAQNIVAKYNGSHKVILNRNQENLGIGGNFQKAYSLSSGEWLFMAAGDDISYENRASEVYNLINKYPNCYGIDTAREVIDGVDNSKGYLYWDEAMLGASSVWNRRLFTDFPPIGSDIMSEDLLLQFRALLMGEVLKTNIVTIKYRIDGNSVSNKSTSNLLEVNRQALKKQLYYLPILNSRKVDLDCFCLKNNVINIKEVENCIDLKIENCKNKVEELGASLTALQGSTKEVLQYLFNKHSISNRKFFRRTNVVVNRLRIFNCFRKNRLHSNYESKINEVIEYRQTMDDYIAEPINIL